MPFFNLVENSTLDTLSTVPENFHSLYMDGEGDNAGKKILNPLVLTLAESYVGTNKSLSSALADKKTASDESAGRRVSLKGFGDFMEGLGLEEDHRSVDGLKSFVEDLVTKSKTGKDLQINMDKINAAAETRIAEAKASGDQVVGKMRNALNTHMVGEVATKAISEAKGSVDLLLPIVAKQCKVLEDGENYVVRVVDEQGDVRSDGAGGWMNIASLVTEMKGKESYARAFDSEQKGGAGSDPAGSQSQKPANQGAAVSSSDKISAGLRKRAAG